MSSMKSEGRGIKAPYEIDGREENGFHEISREGDTLHISVGRRKQAP